MTKQELIDLLRGELEPKEAEALKARLRQDPRLARELVELEALFTLMRRGDEIEPSPALRRRLMAAAERVTAPPLWQRLRQLPGLVRFRFRHSLGFRVAAVSLGVHLLVMLALSILLVESPRRAREPIIDFIEGEAPIHQPAHSFVVRLMQRRLPHAPRLRSFGVAGQGEAIHAGLEALLARQAADGAFGDPAATAYATLALLAEGDCSVSGTRRGRAIRAAVRRLLDQAEAGAVHGAILATLVEDYTLSFDELHEEQRSEYVRAIRRLILAVGGDEISQEALALASLAEFPVPAGRDLGAAATLLNGTRAGLLRRPPSRLTATAVLARGHLSLDRGRVRTWVSGLFEQAVAEVEDGRVSGVVLLTLQAPYRL
ncbi:MAG: hypothetical protein ACYTFD_17040 [Planctomycetota bacterium]|jgi:hypothetical protein